MEHGYTIFTPFIKTDTLPDFLKKYKSKKFVRDLPVFPMRSKTKRSEKHNTLFAFEMPDTSMEGNTKFNIEKGSTLVGQVLAKNLWQDFIFLSSGRLYIFVFQNSLIVRTLENVQKEYATLRANNSSYPTIKTDFKDCTMILKVDSVTSYL